MSAPRGRDRDRKPVGRISIGFAIVLAIFAAAPTVGDIGSCGQKAESLDAKAFFDARLDDECARCQECGLFTRACTRACDKKLLRPSTFPPGCKPVVHDGEVCLHAIESLSCNAFADLVSDFDAIVPTECDFCPLSDTETGGL